MLRALRAHLREPPPARPAAPSRFDYALALAGCALVVLELALRRDLRWPLAQGLAALLCVLPLAPRRARPLRALLASFAVVNALSLAQLALRSDSLGLASGALVLLHPYALLRYGSSREASLGLVTLAGTSALSLLASAPQAPAEALGGVLVLYFPAALGAAARARALARRRELEHVALRERQQLARELHDTVAHRATAIVLQAQAAQAVFDKRPAVAREALVTIEAEARRALDELRSLVRALRDDDAASRAPAPGLDALEALAREADARVRFAREGDLAEVPPLVAAALHRIAGEALHNALRHARDARHIDVLVRGERDALRLVVRDDGAAPFDAASTRGYGLLGMRERAALLGGTLAAGPASEGGWRVEAVLPRSEPPS